MRNRFDQIGKRILRGALEPGGAVATQFDVPAADAQAVDTWFEPAPEREAALRRAGLLGRMATGPTMFEPFHDTPSLDDFRELLRKQLAMDHARVLEARKGEQPRPLFPRLWVLSSGRPESVLRGYGFVAAPAFPAGFYEAPEALSVGVVVLRELPRERSTLLLRLMGAGAVLKDALEELSQLPEGAWERQVAVPALLAARIQITQDSSNEGEREYLMSTQNLYEEWERKTHEKGLEQGSKRALALLYQARFGAMPRAVADAVEATHNTATLERWLVLIGTRSQEEVAAAVQADSPPRTS